MRSNELITASRLRTHGLARVEHAIVENEGLWIREMILRFARAFRYIEEIGDDRLLLLFRRHQEKNAHHAPNLPTHAKRSAYLMPQERATHNLHGQHVVLRRFSEGINPLDASYPFRISTTSPRNTVRVKSQTFTASIRQKFRKSCSPSNSFTADRISSTS